MPASAVVPIPASVPFEVACLIGCSRHDRRRRGRQHRPRRARRLRRRDRLRRRRPVGRSWARRSPGAHPIIAVDVEDASSSRRATSARRTPCAATATSPRAVAAIVPGGADYAFEAIGLQRDDRADARAALPRRHRRDGRHDRRGRARQLLAASAWPSSATASSARTTARRSRRSTSRASRALYEAGKLPIDRLITRRIALDEGRNGAFDDMRARRGGRAATVQPPARPAAALLAVGA